MATDPLPHRAITPSVQPLRFDPGFEVPEDQEAQINAQMNETLHKIQKIVYDDSGHAKRAVHAKSHAIVHGEVHIGALPGVLAQGLFATPGTYPVVMRFSTVPGDVLDDNVSTPRGVALKIIGVEGARLPGAEGDVTQDFVLVNGPTFSAPNAKGFEKNLKLLASTTDKAPGLKKVLSAVLRGTEKVVEGLGGKSATLLALGGQPETHPLGDSYYSQAPILFGDYFVKVSLAPVSAPLVALAKAPVDLKGKPNGLREAMNQFFAATGAEWELRVQLCTDLKTMPIEDPSKEWPEDQSPYVAVGRVVVNPQVAWNDQRSGALEDRLAFNPWHCLAAHRPLGSIMRVRKSAYEMAVRFRAERNNLIIQEPRTLDELAR